MIDNVNTSLTKNHYKMLSITEHVKHTHSQDKRNEIQQKSSPAVLTSPVDRIKHTRSSFMWLPRDKAGVTSLLDRSYDEAVYFRSWAPFCFCSLYSLNVYHRVFNFGKEYLILFLTPSFKEKTSRQVISKGGIFLWNFWALTHHFRDISKNVFLIQQIFTCKQYGAHRPNSQQLNPSDDLSIDKHWPCPERVKFLELLHAYF